MRYWVFILLPLIYANSFSQCKTFHLNSKGDTLNCIDKNNKKQGKWVIRIESLRGEQGYEEEGEFKDDAREGLWRKYNLMGDFISLENYRWGYKDGLSRYFTLTGLEHEEYWRAINPENPYDTVMIPDVNNPDKYEMRVVKRAIASMRNGTWTYYDPETGALLKTETYFLDKLQDTKVDELNIPKSDIGLVKDNPSSGKPKEVIEFEKKIAKKKKITIRDGAVRY